MNPSLFDLPALSFELCMQQYYAVLVSSGFEKLNDAEFYKKPLF
jgi:hypothetical protein